MTRVAPHTPSAPNNAPGSQAADAPTPDSKPAPPASVLDSLRAWPRSRPLAALISPPHRALADLPDARHSLLAEPSYRLTLTRATDGTLRWADSRAPADTQPTTDALADLERLLPALAPTPTSTPAATTPPTPRPETPAHAPGWLIALAYDLGAIIEPHAAGASSLAPGVLIELQRIDHAWTHDAATGVWTPIGDPPPLDFKPSQAPSDLRVGPFRSGHGRDAYREAVGRAIEAIRAGDVFQVNLAHPMRARFAGSAREAFARLADRAAPAFGAYLELDEPDRRRAILSLSPELFLTFDPATRALRTRPMKGTRRSPANPGALDEAARDLLEAEKDSAELTMIVDLMRNDLGRVAELASVEVESPRAIERHPGVLQATATVRATLRRGATIADVLRAAHPPGSITGAPKIRAMQLIDELEGLRRAFAFGAIGMLADTGALALSVAIRTAGVTGAPGPQPGEFADATIEFPVGAGIVADSDPDAEWGETLAKAAHLEALAPIEDRP